MLVLALALLPVHAAATASAIAGGEPREQVQNHTPQPQQDGLQQPGQPAPQAAKKQIAIVIDDFGNDMLGTQEMMDLPIPFTAAVMPFLPTTKRDAEWAHRTGREVILHLPMEPMKGKKSWLGPKAITADLSDEEIRKRVMEALDDVPHVIGINNHMGSKITANERIMRIVLGICKERGLFFLDSRTTPKTVIPKISAELGVKTAGNDLFFDDQYTRSHISKQTRLLAKLIEKNDATIAIGHVGPPGRHTSAALKEAAPQLSQTADFVFVSKLVR
ncbi:divergent polysaccharide deacetylase family protein [Paenibacillus thalictri]|uniref:Divergent polysaccharide deacetylase family protein n=2 Tax=Paenibacillus thalictri TaxID=2527873 RepID=A0A4Q9DZF1_9BACL|nr:divergent polysaccharide deacetylase family protein [Paenibacillus thalictri]